MEGKEFKGQFAKFANARKPVPVVAEPPRDLPNPLVSRGATRYEPIRRNDGGGVVFGHTGDLPKAYAGSYRISEISHSETEFKVGVAGSGKSARTWIQLNFEGCCQYNMMRVVMRDDGAGGIDMVIGGEDERRKMSEFFAEASDLLSAHVGDMYGSESLGNVYVVRAGDSNYYKIGYTGGDPEDRMKQLQTGNPAVLSLVASWSAKREVEGKLHAILADCRKEGEWFELSAQDLLEALPQITAILD